MNLSLLKGPLKVQPLKKQGSFCGVRYLTFECIYLNNGIGIHVHVYHSFNPASFDLVERMFYHLIL